MLFVNRMNRFNRKGDCFMCGYVCDHCGRCKEARIAGVEIPCFHCGGMNPLGMTACAHCGESIAFVPAGSSNGQNRPH